MRSVTIRFVGK